MFDNLDLNAIQDENARELIQRLLNLIEELSADLRDAQADSLNDLRVPPANRLGKLSGSRNGQWSIRINNQWRVCFEWQENDAYQVKIVDYH